MIAREEREGTAILRIEHGKANAVDTELLAALTAALEEVEGTGARAVLLTGRGSIFSAGVDLFRVLEGGADYLEGFLPALTGACLRLFTHPQPVVAWINGHAIAGGCVLACACDYRVMSQGEGRIGVPELRVGVPFPAIALEILRFAVPPQRLSELVLAGRTYGPQEALERGLVDEVADGGEARALEVAGELGRVPAAAFRVAKEHLRRPALDRYEAYRGSVDAEVGRLWAEPSTHGAIRAYLEKTVGKKG